MINKDMTNILQFVALQFKYLVNSYNFDKRCFVTPCVPSVVVSSFSKVTSQLDGIRIVGNNKFSPRLIIKNGYLKISCSIFYINDNNLIENNLITTQKQPVYDDRWLQILNGLIGLLGSHSYNQDFTEFLTNYNHIYLEYNSGHFQYARKLFIDYAKTDKSFDPTVTTIKYHDTNTYDFLVKNWAYYAKADLEADCTFSKSLNTFEKFAYGRLVNHNPLYLNTTTHRMSQGKLLRNKINCFKHIRNHYKDLSGSDAEKMLDNVPCVSAFLNLHQIWLGWQLMFQLTTEVSLIHHKLIDYSIAGTPDSTASPSGLQPSIFNKLRQLSTMMSRIDDRHYLYEMYSRNVGRVNTKYVYKLLSNEIKHLEHKLDLIKKFQNN